MFDWFAKISNNEAYNKDLDRLERDWRKKKVLKLHFGCGPRVLKGWINIDLKYAIYKEELTNYGDKYYSEKIRGGKKDFYGLDVTKQKLPMPNNCVDVIFHEDFLEHLNQKGQILFLTECLRVMKKGAIHRVNTPDLKVSMKRQSEFKKGFEGVWQNEWGKYHHKLVLTKKYLEEIAKMVGYKKVIFGKRNRSVSKLIPKEFRPGLKNRIESENIFADLIK